MRSILLTLWLALLGLALVCPSVPAADPIDWKPIPVGGLNVLLATSGYRFQEASNGVEITSNGPQPGGKRSFVASVSLSNRSRSAIPFSFNDAGPRWIFRIVDAADQEVWRSDSGTASAQVITEDVLGPGKTWKVSARIPLVIDDMPLAPGAYTIQAFLNADKSVSATSVFEVVPAPGQDTGINGLVLKEVADSNLGTTFVGLPAAGVRIQVTEIVTSRILKNRQPFIWSGSTNSEGKFKVHTPAGRFRVSAYEPLTVQITDDKITNDQETSSSNLQIGPIVIVPGFPHASAEVTVQDGAFSDLTLRFKLSTPPSITQGIKGTVRMEGGPFLTTFSGALTTSAELSVVNPQRWFEYEVRVTQIDAPTGTTPFEWTGRADVSGNFQVATPPGKFTVFASRVLAPGVCTFVAIEPATDIETVMVAPNAVTLVNLVLERGAFVVPLAK